MTLTEEQKEKVREMIADVAACEIREVKDESLLSDNLGIDSLDEVDLQCRLEYEFDITITDEDAEEVKIVSDYWPILERLL